ncbi:MAG: DUF4388 domain-containing protein [Thermoanaerobaculales bacterium]|nr:DUF4388 domain-containing protein [Thermoanaerobaculales bacterium]
MAFEGQLNTLSPTEILQLISLTQKTGKLMLSTGQRHGIVIFRNGRIVFAASDTLHSVFDSSLTRVEGDPRLISRIAAILPGSVTDSGAFMITKHHSGMNQLDIVVREQIEMVTRELLQWEEGEFSFEPLTLPECTGPTVDPACFLTDRGVNLDQLLLRTLASLDEEARDLWLQEIEKAEKQSKIKSSSDKESDITAAFRVLVDENSGEITWVHDHGGAHGVDLAGLHSIVGEINRMEGFSQTLTAEVTLLILRYASQVLYRGVFFALLPEGFRGIGQFGLPQGQHPPDQRIREMIVPLDTPSILLQAVMKGRGVVTQPVADAANQLLFQSLGGGPPNQVIVVPFHVNKNIIGVFYGDNHPATERIAALDGLEILMYEVGLAVENAKLQSRLDQLEH